MKNHLISSIWKNYRSLKVNLLFEQPESCQQLEIIEAVIDKAEHPSTSNMSNLELHSLLEIENPIYKY